VKPALRLALGYRDEAKRGAPVKVDHFIAKKGANNEYSRAAAKFTEVYGETAKAIEIRLPSEFGHALDIRYKAFAGAAGGEGGVMVAKGDTNFALHDWVGGPDTLTVWKQDGSVEEIQTAGVDAITGEPLDDVAAELGLELYTTLRFGIPSVLGYGSFCEITTKGKVSTDTLWLKLRGWYNTFGPRTSWVVRPTLCVRPATARPVVTMKDGSKKRIKSDIFVLDVVLSETEDDLLGRLREHAQLTSMVAGDLWGAAPALEPGSEFLDVDEPSPPPAAPLVQSDDGSLPPLDALPDQGREAPLPDEPEILDGEIVEGLLPLTEQELARLPEALKRRPPYGSYQQHTLARIVAAGPSGLEWLAYALRAAWAEDPAFVSDLRLVCKAETPELYKAWIDEGEMGSQ